ncbi:MotE family protein [Radicibacter daui]|uniref:MotE family protein n=1 Tax=Radicibacter daui TaxID=3064829 RepID=UPI004046A3FC
MSDSDLPGGKPDAAERARRAREAAMAAFRSDKAAEAAPALPAPAPVPGEDIAQAVAARILMGTGQSIGDAMQAPKAAPAAASAVPARAPMAAGGARSAALAANKAFASIAAATATELDVQAKASAGREAARRAFAALPPPPDLPLAEAGKAAAASRVALTPEAAAASLAGANRSKLRLIPAVIFVGVLMIGLRVGDIYQDVENGALTTLFSPTLGSTAEAQQPAASTTQPADPNAGQLPQSMENQLKQQQDSAQGPEDKVGIFSNAEQDFQQRLSERRAELDKRARDLDQREALLTAAEQRLDQKIGELTSLRDQINAAIEERKKMAEAEQTANVARLVTIYEGMKPQQAAAIFDQTDMPVLVAVTTRMKEAKLSDVLSRMDPAKAKALTEALANRDKANAEAMAATPVPASN